MASQDSPGPWLTSLALALGAVVAAGYGRFAYGLILPAMRADLGWTYAQAGWINTANALGYLIGSVMTLLVIRRLGSLSLFIIGVIATTLSLAMTGLGESLGALSFWRLMTGVGGAPTFIAGGALAAGLFLNDRRKNAISIAMFFGGGGLGVLLSGLLLPPFFGTYGASAWRGAWYVLAALATISSVPALAVVWLARAALKPPRASGSGSAPPPIARMAPSLVGYGLFAFGYIIYFTFLVAWMHERAIPTSGVVVTWAALGVGSMAGALIWRPVLAASNTGLPLALACLTTGVATLLPLVWRGETAFVVSAALFGIAYFNAPTSVTNFARANLDQKHWGSAVALYTTIFASGQTIGPVGAGWLTDATGDLSLGFIAAGLILFAGAAASALQRAL